MAQRQPEENPIFQQVLKLVDQLSSDELEHLRLRLNSNWVLRPPNKSIDQMRKEAHLALTQAGVTVEELQQEVERIKEERFPQRYPGLGE